MLFNIKNASIKLYAREIFITSQYHPVEILKNLYKNKINKIDPDMFNAINRRIDIAYVR